MRDEYNNLFRLGNWMEWLYLFLADAAEIFFTFSLNYNEGFTRFWPSAVTVFSAISSFYLLMPAIKVLPLGTAFAVWTGMGAVGTAVFGIILCKESTDWIRMASVMLVVLGIEGLKLTHVE